MLLSKQYRIMSILCWTPLIGLVMMSYVYDKWGWSGPPYHRYIAGRYWGTYQRALFLCLLAELFSHTIK